MPSNKPRLFIALYHHKRPGAYHWAFILSPKPLSSLDTPNKTKKYHATNTLSLRDGCLKPTWLYEAVVIDDVKPARLLARVMVGKLLRSKDEMEASFARVDVVQDDPNWRCRTWTMQAMHQLVKDGILTEKSITDWSVIEEGCREYVNGKENQGRYETITSTVPTFDLMTRKEMVA